MAASYVFEDHSGLTLTEKFENPYQGLIKQCDNDPLAIQTVYHRHRTNRNEQQKIKLLDPRFQGVTIDEILSKLESPEDHPGYEDPRNCLVFWARPTAAVRQLIEEVQQKLKTVLPNLWVMPSESLHMTALEVTHSLTAPEIEDLVQRMQPHVEDIVNYPQTHRARLVKPLVSFDAQAFALSFLPAAGESGRPSDDIYTYHHLRRDLYDKVQASGVAVASRYVVPSAHLTIGRYITRKDTESAGIPDLQKMRKLVALVDEINDDIQKRHWASEWPIGQEVGFTCRKGRLWYGGGGETVFQGDGFI